ncbi:uncharacterized protein LOC134344905 [Mobula hypostoma]|uniref:uncharacterized protein LOC134344905 n=1 Tax=Mobula hypostoma TaxID=723540 RepID=UPI002FC2B049
MAYLAVTYKLLIIGILAVTDSETIITYQSSTENSTLLSTPEDTFNTSSTTEENRSPLTNGQTASLYQLPENYTSVATDIYSNDSTTPMDISFVSVNQDNQSISDNIPSSNITDEMTSTEPEVLKSQTPYTQKSSAAPTSTSVIEVSTSTVDNSQKPTTTSAPNTDSSIEDAMLILVVLIALIIPIICLLSYFLYRRKRRYSFDLSQKTAEDANIPLSCPILPGGFELTADKENNKEVEKVNEDKTNHKKDSAPTLNVPEEINGKQSNHEPEINQSPETPAQEGTDTLDDWNFKSEYASFTDINLMDCVTTE